MILRDRVNFRNLSRNKIEKRGTASARREKKGAGAKRANDRRARPRDDGHVRDVILTSADRWRAPHAPSDTQRKS